MTLNRMNTLMVSRELPDPNGVGVERRAAQHLGMLAALGPVTLVLPKWIGLSRSDRIAGLTALGASKVIIREEDPRPESLRLQHHATTSKPLRIWRALNRPPAFDDRVDGRLARDYRDRLGGPFDLLFAFRLTSAVWADSVYCVNGARPSTTIVDLDDIESITFRNNPGEPSPSRLRRILLRRDLWALRAKERQLAQQWSATLLCSALDADRFETITGVRPWIVPNTVRFGPVEPEQIGAKISFLFVGAFGYPPNEHGVCWFTETVWPVIRAKLGEQAELTLAGYRPTPVISAMDGANGIRVLGNVADLAEVYAAANIVIVPLFAGSGTRIKVIEAAAMQRAIISTTLGCEGLDLVAGKHIEIADDPATFADAAIRLATNPERRKILAEAACRHAETLFSIEQVRADLKRKITEKIAKAQQSTLSQR
jgi:glycosyltransferase involved in cell wall biosynthesis